MKDYLKETKFHGTLLYPFQIYYMHDPSAKMFVSHHWHDYVEIIYIKSGQLFVNINNEQYSGKAGDVFFINEEELHEMYVEDTNTLYYAFLFPIKYLSFEMKDYVENSYIDALYNKQSIFISKLPRKCKAYDKICEELDLMIHMNDSKNGAYQFGTKVSLLHIMYLLAEENMILSKTYQGFLNEHNKLKLLKNITLYIENNYKNRIYLETISKEFGMSPKYFCKFFKDNFGKTFIEYLKALRIEKSMIMLVTTDLPIMDIAFASGFENFSYFIRTFKDLSGCTPSYYRKHTHCSPIDHSFLSL